MSAAMAGPAITAPTATRPSSNFAIGIPLWASELDSILPRPCPEGCNLQTTVRRIGALCGKRKEIQEGWAGKQKAPAVAGARLNEKKAGACGSRAGGRDSPQPYMPQRGDDAPAAVRLR